METCPTTSSNTSPTTTAPAANPPGPIAFGSSSSSSTAHAGRTAGIGSRLPSASHGTRTWSRSSQASNCASVAGGSPARARSASRAFRERARHSWQASQAAAPSDGSASAFGQTSSRWRAKAAGTDRIHSLMASDLTLSSADRMRLFRWVLASLWMASNRLSWAARYRGSHSAAYRVGHF